LKKLKIYIAAAWSRRDEMIEVAAQLSKIPGVKINSRWLGPQPNAKRLRALEDVADVRHADLLIRFTDDLTREFVPARLATGSRMFEMGMAYERKIPVIVVGGIQPIFDYLPRITHVRHLDELRNALTRMVRAHQRGR